MHQDALSRNARLTRVREARRPDLCDRRLPITVRIDDDRSVIAKLEPHTFARCLGADAPAHLRRPGEGDEGYIGMIHESATNGRATAGDNLQVTGGKSALFNQKTR